MTDRSVAVLVTASDDFALGAMVALSTALDNLPDGTVGFFASTGLGQVARDLLDVHLPDIVRLDANRWVSRMPVVGRYPRDSWTRLFLAELDLDDETRLLYVDADTLTRSDLADLIELDLQGHAVAALPDPGFGTHRGRGEGWADWANTDPAASYLNTGVLLVDLGEWRRRGITESASRTALNHGPMLEFVDQDALNIVLEGDWLPLSGHWHEIVSGDEPGSEAAIVHFSGAVKPWDVRKPRGSLDREYHEVISYLTGEPRGQ